MRLSLAARTVLVVLASFASFHAIAVAPAADALPNTASLDWPEEDLSGRMMDGAHEFVEAQIAQAREKRQKYWPARDPGDRAVEANRQRLREIVGAVDKRSAPRMERFGDALAPALVAETDSYR